MLQLDSLSGVSTSDDQCSPNYQVRHGGIEACATPGDKEQTSEEEDDRPFTPPPPRERLSYTRYQLALLNGIYQEVRYPNGTQKQLIAKRVGITREQVKIWFQNRRRKDVVTKIVPTRNGSSKSDVKGNASDAKACSPNVPIASPSISDNSSEGCNRTVDDQHGCSRLTDDPQPQTSQNSDTYESLENRTDTSPGNKGNYSQQGSASSASQMVSPVVLRSMIVELNKFNNEYLKLKKSKRKRKKSKGSKPVPTTSAPAKLSSLPSFSSLSSCQAPRLFQSYDMLAPPNKLTPMANTTLHASETSAFRNPRSQNTDSRPWEHLNLSTTTAPSQYNSTDFMQTYCALDNLHPASDMTTRSLNQSASSRVQINPLAASRTAHTNAHLTHLLQRHNVSGFSGSQSSKTFQPHPMAHPSLSLHTHHASHFAAINRAYPFPLVAEPPMMLSSVRQPEPYLQPPSWPTMSSSTHLTSQQTTPASFLSQDSFRPLIITSLNNPYFSPTQLAYSSPRSSTSSPMSWSPRTSDLNNNNHFTQL